MKRIVHNSTPSCALIKKYEVNMFCKYTHLHIIPQLSYKKVLSMVCDKLRWLTACISSIFINSEISKFRRGWINVKKWRFSCSNEYLQIMSPLTRKFQETVCAVKEKLRSQTV